jgi:hypothetical protein
MEIFKIHLSFLNREEGIESTQGRYPSPRKKNKRLKPELHLELILQDFMGRPGKNASRNKRIKG